MAQLTYQLVMQQGPTPGKVYPLSPGDITVGREVLNDIVVSEAEVSRKHARIIYQAGSYILEDLGSTNGTYVAGQRLLGPHALRPGELIMLGEKVSLVFEEVQFDPDATMISAGPPLFPLTQETPEPAPIPEQKPAPVPFPRPDSRTNPPSKPVVPISQPDKAVEPPPPAAVAEKPRRGLLTWILAGCGCLLIILCLCGAVWAFIDQPWVQNGGLYCTPPFDLVFRTLGFCP